MKKIFAILLSFILVLNISVCVYADVPETYQKTKEYLWQIVQDVGYIGTLPLKGLTELVNEILHSKGITGEDVETEEEALDYAFDGITIDGNGNVVLNDDAKQFINYWINDTKLDNQYYVAYSLDLSLYSKTYWWTADLESIISEYGEQYYIFGGATGGNASKWVYYLIDKNKFAPVWRADLGTGLTSRYAVDFYNTKTFDRTAPEGGFYYFERNYNGTIGNMTATTPQAIWSGNKYFQCFVHSHRFIAAEYAIPLQNNYIFVTNGNNENITIYGTLNQLAAYGRGYAPYYYNNEVYSDFSSSTGDFTITNDNKNYVTYGDVTTYIDDHHTETGEYPSIPDINIWIEDQPRPTPNPTPTPDNPSGGGSSGGATATANNSGITINNNHTINIGGNTVSGNGSGSSGSIFDWISDIGGIIGDFVKNVGQLLAEAIRGIAEAISSILETVPNVLSSIVEFVYGGLPDELKALVTLGITAVVFVSVIKILRK